MESQEDAKNRPDEDPGAEAADTGEGQTQADTAAPDDAAGEAAAPEIPDVAAEMADGSDASAVDAELAETKDRLLRALAEAENVRRRASRDVENAQKRAIAGFAREMISVADNLARALASVDAKAVEESEALKSLLTGVDMTAREMMNAFERNAIKKVDPLGERFDPQIHEAMFEFEDASKPAGTVGQVMEPGYTLHGQTIRPAKVGVTKGGPKPESPPRPSDQVLSDGEQDKKPGSGGRAYEDQGKASGAHLDEEL
jgi:molecular chaperone GrpE